MSDDEGEVVDLTGDASEDDEDAGAGAAGAAGGDEADRLRAELAEVDAELESVEARLQELATERAALRQRREALRGGIKQAASARAHHCDWEHGKFAHDARALAVLRETFRLSAFRPLQRGVLNATLSGVDALVLLPAGGGKSLLYELPAVLEARGFTLVVSPLLSLIDDQVTALRALGVNAADLTSATPAEEAAATLASLDKPDSTLRLLYVTPEKVVKSKRFFAKLEKAYEKGLLRRIAVDEAHCISQWGADFRVDYVKLHILKTQFPKAPLLALTATATPDVQASICDALAIAGAARFQASVGRPNLRYEVRPKPAGAAHMEDLAALIQQHWPQRSQSGIVYCLARKETEDVAAQLNSRGISAVCYHAQMETQDRLVAHRGWAAGRVQVIVATVCFGMGINKCDVRFVIHHTISKSIETYYQESGRAGRDGAPARCIAYFSPKDFGRQAGMVFYEAAGMRRLIPLIQYCMSSDRCRHGLIATHFGETIAPCGANCDVCAPGDAAQVAAPMVDLSAHAASLVATAREVEAAGKNASVLQLIDAWRKSKRPETVALAKSMRADDAELFICRLLLDNVLTQKFSSTAYATNVYITAGSAATAVTAGRLAVHLPLRMQMQAAPTAAKRKAYTIDPLDDSGDE